MWIIWVDLPLVLFVRTISVPFPLPPPPPQPSTVGIKANQGSKNRAVERRGKEWASGLTQEVFWENIKVWYFPITRVLEKQTSHCLWVITRVAEFFLSWLFEESWSKPRFLVIKSWKIILCTHSSLVEAFSRSERTFLSSSEHEFYLRAVWPALHWKGIRIGIQRPCSRGTITYRIYLLRCVGPSV